MPDRPAGYARNMTLTDEVREDDALAGARWWVEADRYAAASYGPDSLERRLLARPLADVIQQLVAAAGQRVASELWPDADRITDALRAELERCAGSLGLSAGELDRLQRRDDPVGAAHGDLARTAELERRWTILRRELVARLGDEWVGDGALPNTPRGELSKALGEA
jgi:hypothetical protein